MSRNGKAPSPAFVEDLDTVVQGVGKKADVAPQVAEDADRPPWAGGNPDENPNRPTDRGKPDNAGTKKGGLYGDQMVVLRDLDPDDADLADGNGEPLLDANGNPIVVGYDGDMMFPIYFVPEDPTAEDIDWIIPDDLLPYVQEVDLGRANVARAPAKVTEKALYAALEKIETADDVDVDLAGRITYVVDGQQLTIDSPLENLALYQALMTTDPDASPDWDDTVDGWSTAFNDVLTDGDVFTELLAEGWSPASLLGAAWDKYGEITLDAMIYENTTLGINEFNFGTEATTYFSFNRVTDEILTEAFDYDRVERYGGYEVTWYELDENNVPQQQGPMSLLEAVFPNEDRVEGEPAYEVWKDVYMTADGTAFVEADASQSGTNDFAQAADDARAVIAFMHDAIGLQITVVDADAAFIA